MTPGGPPDRKNQLDMGLINIIIASLRSSPDKQVWNPFISPHLVAQAKVG
jgi:hypothetical protein